MPDHSSQHSPEAFDPFSGPDILLTAPSTEPQREIWLATRVGVEASLAFNESISLHLTGAVDVPAMRRALRDLVARHEALRSTFTADGLTLCVNGGLTFDVPFVDWSGNELGDRDHAWQQLLAEAVEEPFDLEQGPLVRVMLLRYAPEDHRAIITAHHIVCDGWSTAVLLKDLTEIYNAIVKNASPGLPQAESFSGYARTEAGRTDSKQARENEEYWVQQFSADVPVLDLPTDHPRPAFKTYSSRREDLTLDAGLIGRLKRAGAKERTSLFVVLLAGFKCLLSRLTSQLDLVVGIPAAGQSVGGHASLVGHCVHLLPIRTQFEATAPFKDLLTSVRTKTLDAMEHQEFTFARLLERLPVHRDPARLPLVSVIFNLDKGIGTGDLKFDGLSAWIATNPRHFENFELFLNAVELDGRVTLECQFNTDLFDGSTVKGWLEAYSRLLEGIAENIECEIARLPIVPLGDVQLLASWNATGLEFPPVCVHELIESQVERSPNAIAVDSDRATITYGDLNRRANRLAHRLRAAGVAQNVLVGLCVERSIDMLVGLLAVLKAGGGYVPLDPGYPTERLAFMASDSGMPILLTERKLNAELHLQVGQVVCVDDSDLDAHDELDLTPVQSKPDPESIAYVIYTSGSTGRPKGVMVPHRSVVNLLTSVKKSPGITEHDVVLAITTLSFDIAVSELLLPLSAGARIVLATRETASDGVQLLRLIRRAGVTFIDATPSTWRLLLDAGWPGDAGLKAICTGEAMPRDLAIELVKRAGSVWNGYGPTETTVWSTFYQVTEPVGRVLIGRPVGNTQIHILDEHLEAVPIGVPGELYIGGSGVTLGYLNRPDLTEQRFVPSISGVSTSARMYRTGDIARYLRSGNVECLGRNDDQVKIRGFRIELGEIEEALAKHDAIARVAVIAREDRPGDKRLVAYVVTRPGRSVSDSELKAHLQLTLPVHMIPAAFVRLETMPLTPSGKVNRRNLPPPDIETVASTEGFVAPRSATEAMLAQLWQQALGIGRISIHDDFFSLGGHSLLASQVLARLRKDHGIEVLFRKLFEAPTVARFAEVVDSETRRSGAATSSIARRAPGRLRRLSVMQERLWLLEMMDPNQRLVHNLPAAWKLSGQLDPEIIERCLNEIVSRHETLRTSIRVKEGVPFQEVSSELRIALGRVDLRQRPEREREPAMMALFESETQRPYDLSIAPLMRVTLVQLEEHEHVLFILPHNLIWDGWSFDIFLREFGALYNAANGTPSQLAEQPIAYGDFAEWQREWLESPESAGQREWWRAQLAGDLPVLEMPSDRQRPAERTWVGGNVELHLSRQEVDALGIIARESGGTLFTVLFAAFCLLLHKTSGQNDLVIGTPVRARTRPETEDLIGPFMNVLVMRSKFDEEMTFLDFLAHVRNVTLDSFSHQELPLEVVDIRAPILRAFFSLQDARSRPLEFVNLEVRQLHVLPLTAAADLMLWTMETKSGLLCALNYSAELYDSATMQRFLERYRSTVLDIVGNPQRKAGDIQIIAKAEQALLDQFGSPHADNFQACLHTLIEQHAKRTPDAVAVRSDDQQITYLELDNRANELVIALRAIGVSTGSPVGILLERSADLAAVLLGVMKTGAVPVMLDPGDPPTRVVSIIEDAHILVVVTTEQRRSTLPPPEIRILTVGDLPATGHATSSLSAAVVSPDASAIRFYESDASGLHPVDVSHRTLANTIASVTREIALNEHDVLLAVLAPSLDAAAIELLAPLAVGARIVVASSDTLADAEQLGQLVVKAEISVVIAPTSVWRDALPTLPNTNVLRVVCIGDLPSTELKASLIAGTAGAWMAHGTASAGIWSTLHLLAPGEPNGVLGRPFPGAPVRIFDGRMRVVPIGCVGELWLGDPLSRTGELARWRSDGALELVAPPERHAFINGFLTDLEEIARALRKHGALEDAAVLMQSRQGVARLTALVVPRTGAATFTDSELRRYLRQMLPERMVPRAFTVVDKLARDGAGNVKVAKDESNRASDDFVAPTTGTELMLARVWAAALGLEHISIHDNFFALGGYSLLCFQVLDRIERETRQRLSPRALLLDSLQQVAARLDRG